MDLITGLQAATQAIDIAKELRNIDRGVDEAAFKLKLAELTSLLADAKLALADAKEEIGTITTELDSLKFGELCPKCRSGRLQLQSAEKHRYRGLGDFGVEDWKYRYDNTDCAFEQTRMHDPHGAVPRAAGKRR